MGAIKPLGIANIRHDAYPAWNFIVPNIDCFRSLDANVKSILKGIFCLNVFAKSIECQHKDLKAPNGQVVELLSNVTKNLGILSEK